MSQKTLRPAAGQIRSATRDSRGYIGRVDRGLMVKSFTAGKPTVEGNLISQEVFSQPPAADYAIVHEKGRRPGKKPPPVAPIRAWLARTSAGRRLLAQVRAQYVQGGKEPPPDAALLDRLAFLVARAIGRRGIPGLFMFALTAEEMAKGPSSAIFKKHLDRHTGRVA